MGIKPISLTTNGINPSLTVTGAALSLGGNPFTVMVPGSALTAGVYTLVSAASISGTVNPTALYGGSGLTGGATGVVSISGNTVILTVTVVSTYTMTYDGNGNTSGTAPADGSSPYSSGATVTVVGPGSLAKTGYAFANWNTAADGSGTSYNPADTFTITFNTTLYARWIVNYASWASTYAGGGAANADFDNDGVSNGVEYFLNITTPGFTANPALNGSNAITWSNGGNIPPSAYGSQYVVQTSGDLVNWTDVPSGSLTTNSAGPGGSLTYILTGTAPRFVRLKVTPN